MADTLPLQKSLPVGSIGRRASGWWGMIGLIATEAALFGYLLFSYFYLYTRSHGGWLPELPKLRIALPNTIILIVSSLILAWGERGIRQGKRGRLLGALALSFVLGVVFIGLQMLEWHSKPFGLTDSAYGSLFFTITGFHVAHVVGGLLMLATLFVWTARGDFSAARHSAVSTGALYWHFVDVVWLCVFTTFYISPYLL